MQAPPLDRLLRVKDTYLHTFLRFYITAGPDWLERAGVQVSVHAQSVFLSEDEDEQNGEGPRAVAGIPIMQMVI